MNHMFEGIFIALAMVLAGWIYGMGGLNGYSVLSGPIIMIWIFLTSSVFWFVFTIMIFNGIIFIIFAIFKSEAIYLKPAKTVILALVIYLIAQFLSYTAIFRHFYLSL